MRLNAPQRELLTVDEIAVRLAVHRATVYRAIDRGELQARRLGENGSYRVTEAALEAFLRPVRT